MLKISPDQIQALSASSLERFITLESDRLTRVSQSTNLQITPDKAWVRCGIEEGTAFGMHSERDHARYNELRLTLGTSFPDEDDIEVLEQEDLWGWQKLDELEGRLAVAAKPF